MRSLQRKVEGRIRLLILVRWDENYVLCYPFSFEKTFEFDPDGVDIRSNCLKNNFVRILNGFQDRNCEVFL